MSRKKNKKRARAEEQQVYLLSESTPFSVREAYKALRTNLIFSLPGEKCKKILITSANQHEGKSTVAINLGIAFAQNNANVLLIDCDLRLPTAAQKVSVDAAPGLSNLLVGMCSASEAIRHLDNGLDLMPAGNIPPNPSELLGSAQMEALVKALEEYYEYIIFDTPPISVVTDAIVLSKVASGIVLVVRRDISTQDGIQEAVSQLELANTKLLGFLFTGALNEHQKSYRHYYEYGHGG